MKGGIEAAAVGRVGRDPELRRVKGGELALLTFSVAVDDDDVPPEWLKVAVFGDQAEALADRLRKGDRVYVEGRLRLERWEGRDGAPSAGLSLNAKLVQALGQIGRRRLKAPRRPGLPAADDDAAPFDDPIPFGATR